MGRSSRSGAGTAIEGQRSPGHPSAAVRPGARGRERIRVLHSLRPNHRRSSNPFVHQFVDSLPDEVESRFWTWRRALFGRYDVVHVQWFEYNLRSRNAGKRLALRLGVLLVCLRWSATRRPVVTTVHNERPHEPGTASELRLLRRVDALTTHRIHLNAAGADGPHDSTILHGHYRARLAGLPEHDAIPGRVISFGSIRAYKNVPALAGAFSGICGTVLAPQGPTAPSLHIVGACPDAAIRAELTCRAAADPRITVALTSVPEDRLVREVRSAQLVVLPYTDMLNSGALLLALSCGRPALVPGTSANLALAAEVGARWVQTFDGQLTTQHLVVALEVAARASAWPDPDLSARDWTESGRRYADIYRALALQRSDQGPSGRAVCDRPADAACPGQDSAGFSGPGTEGLPT
jgi:beta-1,4-mannosyltransferase